MDTETKRRKPTKAELLYAAGLFDGEGCMGFYDEGVYAASLRVAMTTVYEPLFFFRLFGGTLTHNQNPQKPTHTASLRWCLHGRPACISVLKQLIPYVKTKKPQLVLIYRWLVRRRKLLSGRNPGSRGLPKGIREIDQRVSIRLKKLKRDSKFSSIEQVKRIVKWAKSVGPDGVINGIPVEIG